ncbi:alpha-S1-casein-like [Nycticebus coucang]|uniref:alpha-S1-casein-like n=1 Tax=Nycticebus coucang TaxID=9470 RepID=UPI00234C31A1|nr:alpha-S1-casein-like [Nycticebus coucang]
MWHRAAGARKDPDPVSLPAGQALTTMKLLILTCLVAVALARPKIPVRPLELIQNQPDNHEQEILKQRNFLRLDPATPVELTQEYFNQLNRQRELLRQKQSEEIQERTMAETERDSSISSSSEVNDLDINSIMQ